MKLDFNSLKFKNWLYLMIFSVFILGLFWILQSLFLKSFYQNMKIQEFLRLSQQITSHYGDSNFNRIVNDYAFNNNLHISIINKEGKVSFSSNVFNVLLQEDNDTSDVPQKQLNNIKKELKNNPNAYISYISNTDNRSQMVYATSLIDSQGVVNYLVINSPLPVIDSAIGILENQLVIITLILLVLSLVVAQLISRKLSIPIIKLNQSAKELARGNFNVEFPNTGYSEIKQLSNTLTYATKELSTLEAYRKEFIANVSHDLKTPLTIIKFYGEMIQDVSGSDEEKRKKHCSLIIRETDRLTDLVNEVLELSKLESKQDEIKKVPLNITKILYEVIESFQVIFEKDGYTFKTDIDKDLIAAADARALKRVFYNLISNAINYSGKSLTITISLKNAGKNIRFSVTDQGPGIDPEDLDNIWDRYYKSKENHNRGIVGTGLGLSIVKNILIQHQAEYGVESKKGKGSTFWFQLKKK